MKEAFPPERCPHCQALLDDGDIVKYFLKICGGDKERARSIAEEFGWTEEDPKRFSRIIGIYSTKTDRTEFYVCPECSNRIDGTSTIEEEPKAPIAQ